MEKVGAGLSYKEPYTPKPPYSLDSCKRSGDKSTYEHQPDKRVGTSKLPEPPESDVGAMDLGAATIVISGDAPRRFVMGHGRMAVLAGLVQGSSAPQPAIAQGADHRASAGGRRPQGGIVGDEAVVGAVIPAGCQVRKVTSKSSTNYPPN